MTSNPTSIELPAGEVTAEALCAALRSLAEAGDAPGPLDAVRLVIVVARRKGAILFRRWLAGRDGWPVVERAVERAMAAAVKAEHYPDALQIEVGWPPVRTTLASVKAMGRSQVGRKGLALLEGTRVIAVRGAMEMIAANRDHARALERQLAADKMPPDAVEKGAIAPALFDSLQFLLRLQTPPRLDRLWRGNRIVDAADVDSGSVRALAENMMLWMRNQVGANGRIIYKYFPSSGREADGDNSIRQAMATVCLNRIALQTGLAADRDIADRNLGHLLRVYYRAENALGYIAEGEKAKLGAAALAALAIIENPGAGRYREPLTALSNTVDSLWLQSGEFRTFLKPADRNDNQNFYPGEALLFWAARLAQAQGADDPARFLQSFAFYREHFRANPNPAFVPWHSQAYYMALPYIGNAAAPVRDFIFEMNDWLLSMQQWDTAPHPDLRGRFYDPHRPYGPPHASSTGVYLEGLTDALELARSGGDAGRAGAYRLAILRGLRSLMQLQFRDGVDMFYVSQTERVLGGIRTEAYDNSIRVDNVQHGLMALLKILTRMSGEDLRLLAR